MPPSQWQPLLFASRESQIDDTSLAQLAQASATDLTADGLFVSSKWIARIAIMTQSLARRAEKFRVTLPSERQDTQAMEGRDE
jgi:hypothetical protein